MDINLIREAVTVLSFVSFLAIVGWAWSAQRRASFEQLGRSVLDVNEGAPAPQEVQSE
jgi:cbb3-type cytochrome oxidase subunit 3